MNDTGLTIDEISVLKDVLDVFENQQYVSTGMKGHNGGYATADMFSYDDDKIDIELEWGRQDMGDGRSTCHVEQYTLDRDILHQDIPLKEKVSAIEYRS